jgi:hypothetical protein
MTGKTGDPRPAVPRTRSLPETEPATVGRIGDDHRPWLGHVDRNCLDVGLTAAGARNDLADSPGPTSVPPQRASTTP